MVHVVKLIIHETVSNVERVSDVEFVVSATRSSPAPASAKESEYENMESDAPDQPSDEESKRKTEENSKETAAVVHHEEKEFRGGGADDEERREQEEIASFEEEERMIAELVAKVCISHHSLQFARLKYQFLSKLISTQPFESYEVRILRNPQIKTTTHKNFPRNYFLHFYNN